MGIKIEDPLNNNKICWNGVIGFGFAPNIIPPIITEIINTNVLYIFFNFAFLIKKVVTIIRVIHKTNIKIIFTMGTPLKFSWNNFLSPNQ